MSRSTSSALRTVSMFACIVLFTVMAHAQYRTSIQGVVTDTTGAVIPGANLTLTNPATGETQVRVSNDARYLQLQRARCGTLPIGSGKRRIRVRKSSTISN